MSDPIEGRQLVPTVSAPGVGLQIRFGIGT